MAQPSPSKQRGDSTPSTNDVALTSGNVGVKESSLFLRLRSPVMREFQELPRTLLGEFDRFIGKAKLANLRSQDSFRTTKWTMTDLYDTVGNAHDKRTLRSPAGVSDKSSVLTALNTILDDTTCVITFDQVKALHDAIFEHGDGGGAIREDAAVGYASERIYRVFLPAVEIEPALREYVATLNDEAALPHPLLRAYYAFSALVFYIHPFYDGNGRCARLLGNILARKGGFPPVIRHQDKTIQLAGFLETMLNTVDLHEDAIRFRRNRLAGKTTSTWF
ncbi:hypothetical protein H310_01715 [Aphanomyces invadans]|uniref:Fido domain-containing protein n=1 Tax=Aphanomyces invadans TaxID=157072 RepID=A0A024UUM0_9STRA|nr:hypothetical protein H310_01715 [Aphanomyces invadans]ETW09343.1 hypothetical protein H310_01715 [Aphanomyces invadans]|eukprot:XP_008863148.1 hypothetical protein H310_01715 [Aphanomyces invadans]